MIVVATAVALVVIVILLIVIVIVVEVDAGQRKSPVFVGGGQHNTTPLPPLPLPWDLAWGHNV